MARRSSLFWRLTLVVSLLIAGTIALAVQLDEWLSEPWIAGAIAFGVSLPITLSVLSRILAPQAAMSRALAGTVTSYRDGDFAFSLAWNKHDELGELVDAHNALGETLRKQRESLVQRELLLDTMVQ